MGIQDDDIERLRSTVSIVDTIQQYVALKRVGRNWVGLCPFHAEQSGSFNVREETGRYKCFGCQAAGDVFTFVQEIEHLDFVGAVEHLAAKAGMQLTYTSTGQSKERARRKQLIEAMAARGRVVPPAPARRPGRAAGARLPASARVWRATWRGSSRSAGRPTTGTRSSRDLGRTAGELLQRHRAGVHATSATGCRTRSGRG